MIDMRRRVQGLSPRLWVGLRIALTLGLLFALWRAVDGAEITAALAGASLIWVVAAVGCLILQTGLSALRWRVTAGALHQHLGMGYALREYFLSQAVNQALPGAVMGDAARAVRARASNGLKVAGQAVFFERLAGQIAMIVVFAGAFLATDALAGGVVWPPAFRSTIYACLIVGSVAVLIISVTARAGLAPVLAPLHRALLARPVLPAQITLGAVITLCNLAAFACAARAVGLDLSIVETLALVPVLLFAMLVPLTVSGWGVREGAAALILPLAGASAASAIAASILYGVAILFSVLPGIGVALRS